MSTIQKLASQTVIYGLSNILPRILNYFLLVFIYTRVLQLNEYGEITKLFAYVAFLVVLLTYGMETAFFNFSRKPEYSTTQVFTTAFKLHIATTIFFIISIIIFANPLAQWLNVGNHAIYIILLGLILAIDTLCALPFALLRKQNKAKRFAFIKVINIVSNIIFNILFLLVFYKEGRGVLSDKVTLILIALLIASIITFLLLLPSIVWDKKKSDTLKRAMLIYALPLLFAGLAGMVNEALDRAMMENLLPTNLDVKAQTGIYGACYRLAMLMSIFMQAYRFAAEPFFFNTDDENVLKLRLSQTTTYLLIICLIILLAIWINLPWISLLIGEKYRVGIFIVPYLLIAYVFLTLYTNLTMWFKLSGKTLYGLYFTCTGAVITIACNYYLIPRYGILGGAIATLVCYTAMFIINSIVMHKIYPIALEWKKLLIYSFFATIILVAYVSLNNSLWVGNIGILSFLSFVLFNEKINKILAQKL